MQTFGELMADSSQKAELRGKEKEKRSEAAERRGRQEGVTVPKAVTTGIIADPLHHAWPEPTSFLQKTGGERSIVPVGGLTHILL